MPFCLRKPLQQLAAHPRQRRRAAHFGKNSQPRTAILRQLREMLAGEGGELRPTADPLPAVDPLDDVLAAVGIVKLQNGRLGKGVGRAETRRMLGIALDLDRPPVHAGDQQAQGLPAMSIVVANRWNSPGMRSAGRLAKGRISRFSQRQPATPASASDAPINCSHRRRLMPSNRRPPADSGRSNRATGGLYGSPWNFFRLTMTCRAIRRGMDVVFFHQASAQQRRVLLGHPRHVGDVPLRPQMARRVAMAIQAPAHAQLLGLVDPLHLVNAAVAGDAAHAPADVGAMVEINVVGQVVDALPVDGSPPASLWRISNSLASRWPPSHGSSCRWPSAARRPRRPARRCCGSSGSRCPVGRRAVHGYRARAAAADSPRPASAASRRNRRRRADRPAQHQQHARQGSGTVDPWGQQGAGHCHLLPSPHCGRGAGVRG